MIEILVFESHNDNLKFINDIKYIIDKITENIIIANELILFIVFFFNLLKYNKIFYIILILYTMDIL